MPDANEAVQEATREAVREAAALARWSTPTIYNGWEAITRSERTTLRLNREEVTDYLPQAGPMVGTAVTLVIEPSNPRWPRELPDAVHAYRAYVASVPGPKVVVVQDLDGVVIGSFWGEVNANVHRALGCVGTITDGAIRDLDEVRALGFRPLARRLCVGHAYAQPVRWNLPVTVFGTEVRPGDLIHADQHGFMVIPEEDRAGLVEAAAHLDAAERATLIGVAAAHDGTPEEALPKLSEAQRRFAAIVRERYGSAGEFGAAERES
jgi:4-hydroxy-4-methyl-2-oxoglutarate aldolase